MHSAAVVLISCSKLKRTYPCEARLLYDASSLFRKSLAYAKTISNDIFVISAKHGLVSLDSVIAPYEETLSGKTSLELAAWGKRVAEQIAERFDIQKTDFIILAGKNYYAPLRDHLSHISLPLLGLPFGERLSKLDALINADTPPQDTMCLRLHKLFNNMPRFRWDAIDNIGFDNGIYIIFEDGETYHGLDRIVRVGTHRSDGRLRRRLKDHFMKENKDGSIFRKNIGRAILNKNRSPYLEVWNIDSRDSNTIMNMGSQYDSVYQKKVEAVVSKYMREHFTLTCFPVSSEEERLRLEEGIIASLNGSADFYASLNWKGKYSPEIEIAQSGLWLKQGLDGTPLSEDEYILIEKYSSGAFSVTESQITAKHHQHPASTKAPKSSINESRTRTADVVNYLENTLDRAKASGKTSIIIRCGKVHKELGLISRMPTVCHAMRKLMKPDDVILHQPPKGNGATLEIEYFL